MFHYEQGALRGEDTDTDGDGAVDRFDHFDASGQVDERGEDLDGDGIIDILSIFRDGKLVRRQIHNPDLSAEAAQRQNPSRGTLVN